MAYNSKLTKKNINRHPIPNYPSMRFKIPSATIIHITRDILIMYNFLWKKTQEATIS